MDGGAIVSVSAAVVALTQLCKWAFLPDKWGPVSVMVFALAGVVFWGWSVGTFERTQAFAYFAGWLAVATSASGVYGFSRASGDVLTKMKSPPGGAGNEPPVVPAPMCVVCGLAAAVHGAQIHPFTPERV